MPSEEPTSSPPPSPPSEEMVSPNVMWRQHKEDLQHREQEEMSKKFPKWAAEQKRRFPGPA
jgi:hypothetical protein